MQSYSQNPMTYAGALDVNIYIKRNFAPMEDRVRSVIAILNQAPQIISAARANLAESLPRPQVETAIEEADGAADFLSKDLVAALKNVKNENADGRSSMPPTRGPSREMRAYAAYLKEQKLPKANDRYALGREKYRKLLEYGEMVTCPRSNCWKSACANCGASSRSLRRRPGRLIPPGSRSRSSRPSKRTIPPSRA